MNQAVATPLVRLIDLNRRARLAGSLAELRFLLVNETLGLAAYRQAALWFEGLGVQALSGVVQVEANAPYGLWLSKLLTQLAATHAAHGPIDMANLPEDLRREWSDWLPAQAYWLPIPATEQTPAGGLLLARDLPWVAQEGLLLAEWVESWGFAYAAGQRSAPWSWERLWQRLRHPFAAPQSDAGQPWWRRRSAKWGLAVIILLLFPVRLTVLAPGELVPANPDVIRAPLDGVVAVFHVQPNQLVRQGQPLLSLDEAILRSKLEVAQQSLATAEAEYRQAAQQALTDAKAKAMLAPLAGRIEEKRAEAFYLREQLGRAQIVSSRDGIALFDAPSEWIGRPVKVGERIMRVADPGDIEVEGWIAVADAIPLKPNAAVSLYLNASPLAPVDAQVRYLAHEAVERPDGTYAYRLRATLTETTTHRVGLKGTVRLSGGWVPMIYWMLRRPWASLRGWVGW